MHRVIAHSGGSEEFVARILATPAETARVTRFSLYMLPVRKFA